LNDAASRKGRIGAARLDRHRSECAALVFSGRRRRHHVKPSEARQIKSKAAKRLRDKSRKLVNHAR